MGERSASAPTDGKEGTNVLNHSRLMWLGATVGTGVILAAAVLIGASSAHPQPRLITVDASAPRLELGQMTAMATLVAIVQPTGKTNVHWNSADNTEWSGPVGQAMIIRDDEFKVLHVFKGDRSLQSIVVRGVGGPWAMSRLCSTARPSGTRHTSISFS